MDAKILGFILIFLGSAIVLPFLFKFFARFMLIVLGCYLVYIGLQKIGAHQILFHIDRFVDRILSFFN